MRILIKNGTVINGGGREQADVLIEDDRIVALVGRPDATSSAADKAAAALVALGADETIDATGKWVIPGAIDEHTHMELPFGGTFAKDTFETGSRAAAFGGTTTIIDFAVQSKGKASRRGSTSGWRRPRATPSSTTRST